MGRGEDKRGMVGLPASSRTFVAACRRYSTTPTGSCTSPPWHIDPQFLTPYMKQMQAYPFTEALRELLH